MRSPTHDLFEEVDKINIIALIEERIEEYEKLFQESKDTRYYENILYYKSLLYKTTEVINGY